MPEPSLKQLKAAINKLNTISGTNRITYKELQDELDTTLTHLNMLVINLVRKYSQFFELDDNNTSKLGDNVVILLSNGDKEIMSQLDLDFNDVIDKFKKSSKLTIILFLLIFSLMFSGFLFENVATGEYGLARNTFTGVVNTDQVYDPGIYFVPFQKMIIFPAIFQTIEFKDGDTLGGGDDNVLTGSILTATTQDGLPISIELSFQYRILKDYVTKIYLLYGESYAATYLRIARDSLRDAAAKFNATTFYYDRQSVGILMQEYLINDLEKIVTDTASIQNEISTFQLRKTLLPAEFTQALQNLENSRLAVLQALESQKIAIIEAETKIKEAEAAAAAEIIRANGSAQSYLIQIRAQAEAVNITLNAQADALYALGQSLNMTSAELLAFLWIQAITEAATYGNLIIIGEQTPVIISVNGTANTW